jgi:hypothetical protein
MSWSSTARLEKELDNWIGVGVDEGRAVRFGVSHSVGWVGRTAGKYSKIWWLGGGGLRSLDLVG